VTTPIPLAPVALLAGMAAAILQMAGALKTAPPLAGLPVDLTLASLALLLPALALLAVSRRWRVDRAIALPLAAAGLFWAWLVVAGAWSPSAAVLSAKLPEATLAGPLMLAAGMLVGAESSARRALAATTIAIGALLAAIVAWGVLGGWGLAALLDPEAQRLQYQLAGLAMATAAALAAVKLVEAPSWPGRAAWAVLILALAAAALLPGGRTALVALLLGVALAPALRLPRARALGWAAAVAAAGLAGLAWLLLHPDQAEGLRTLERLTGDAAGLDARRGLWSAALDWGGLAAPLGLGTGGFTIAAGHGERRGLYPHNHALEALAEGGLPGLVLWIGAFGGAAFAMLRLAPAVPPARLARMAAMVLPVAMTIMVSTDLGNRMAWFALGLALSLGLSARVIEDRAMEAGHA
jgi:O-antigen ligase